MFRKASTYLIALLVISVFLNIALVLRVAGSVVEERSPGHIRGMIRALPEDSRQILIGELRNQRAEAIEHIRGLRVTRNKAAELMRQEPLDKVALETAFKELGDHTYALQLATQRAIVEAAVQMSVEDRVAMLDWRRTLREKRKADIEAGAVPADCPASRREAMRKLRSCFPDSEFGRPGGLRDGLRDRYRDGPPPGGPAE